MNMESSSAHKATLAHARVAIRARTYWSAFSERPVGNAYGEGAVEAGEMAFKALLGKQFPIDQPNSRNLFAGAEKSPYGMELGITYPRSSVAELVAAGQAAMAHWPAVGPDARAEVLIEDSEIASNTADDSRWGGGGLQCLRWHCWLGSCGIPRRRRRAGSATGSSSEWLSICHCCPGSAVWWAYFPGCWFRSWRRCSRRYSACSECWSPG